MTEILSLESASVDETNVIGEKIAQAISFPSCIYLHGDMGQGKTTLCKSIIAALGSRQTVTSPTYNLVQEYEVNSGVVYHMDLYRLDDPEELEYLALSDLWTSNSVFLVEWPQKGHGFLQQATHEIVIEPTVSNLSRQISFREL